MIDNTRPAYRILSTHGFYGPDDNLWPEGAELYFDGEPNEEMEPLNAVAETKLRLYLERLDALGREAAAKSGKAFAGRARSLDGALEIATALQRQEMVLMSARKDVTNIAPLNASDTDETGSANPKRARGRPRIKTISSVAAA